MSRITDVADVEAFLKAPKTLQGGMPAWGRGGFRGEWTAAWPIEDANGIVMAHLRFRARPGDERCPSISCVVRGNAVYRLDIVPATECKTNPTWAAQIPLPPRVCGPHVHAWNDNRDYLLWQDQWQLPARRSLPPQIRRLEQAVPWLGNEINLTLTGNQREFTEPVGSLF